jgi:hypothetical protein
MLGDDGEEAAAQHELGTLWSPSEGGFGTIQ